MSWLAPNSSLETEPEFKFSSVFPLYYYLFLSLLSPLWTLFIQTLTGRTYCCSAIYISSVGTTRVRQNSSCWGILPWKPCPLQCHNEPLWHSSGKWSGCSFPFLGCCGALGGTDTVRGRFGFKSLIFFLKPWRGINSPGTNRHNLLTVLWRFL